MYDSPTIISALANVGPRLKHLRTQRDVTLAALAEATGISKSTLSRLEPANGAPAWTCCFRSPWPTRCRWTNWSTPCT